MGTIFSPLMNHPMDYISLGALDYDEQWALWVEILWNIFDTIAQLDATEFSDR